MNILYGVVGEGMGHATRSAVVLEHLVKRHEVRVVVSGSAHAYLKRRFPHVSEIEGLKMAFEGAAVDRSQTFWQTLKRLPQIVSHNFDEFIRLSEEFAPDLVLSDFESFAYTFAKHHDLPVISLDNMQVINRCHLEVEIPRDQQVHFRSAKALVKAKLPGCYHYLITTFFFPPLRKQRTSLHPPVLRQEILDAESTSGEHLLVYRTSGGDDALLEMLEQTGLPCRVYGYQREEKRGQLELRPFSERGFVKDLASCRAVVAPGGFSLMGEALHLRKPMLAVPLRKQFEQLLNALYLERLGYGRCCFQLSVGAIHEFWADLEQHEQALASYRQDGNQQILRKLDQLLAEIDSARAAG
jgi:uncharacterized protein (TIGR00661 family)